MDVSKNRDTPKWMVKIMENPIKMDDLGGKTHYFWKHPIRHIHPGRLTWNLIIHPWKRKIIFQTIIFRFYVNLPGCIQIAGAISFSHHPSGLIDSSHLLQVDPSQSVFIDAKALKKKLKEDLCKEPVVDPYRNPNGTGRYIYILYTYSSWWFQIFFIFTPTWGWFPIWGWFPNIFTIKINHPVRTPSCCWANNKLADSPMCCFHERWLIDYWFVEGWTIMKSTKVEGLFGKWKVYGMWSNGPW